MPSTPWVEDLKRDVRLRRLKLLEARATLEGREAHEGDWKRPWRELSYYHWMETWSKKAQAQIDIGIARGATGSNVINWNIALYAWMESAATYLRWVALGRH